LIHELSDSIHLHKKYVKFGVSPFGIWKNKAQDPEGSETAGGDSYYGLYADSKKWVQKGWVDYINPQIYWSFETKAAPYDKLVDWWSKNSFGRNLYIGQGAYRINATNDLSWKSATQFSRQLNYNRANSNVQGSVYFSSKSLTKNPLGIADTLAKKYYRTLSLPPVMPWLDALAPNRPDGLAAIENDFGIQLNWKLPLISAQIGKDKTYGFVVYRFDEGQKIDLEDANSIKTFYYNTTTSWQDYGVEKGKTYTYVVTTLDRLKNESLASSPFVIAVKTAKSKSKP